MLKTKTLYKQLIIKVSNVRRVAIVDKAELSDAKMEKINTAITYFTNHKHKMDYKTFIEKGYPVSSALVESNCGYFVKHRMEGNGRRWTELGCVNHTFILTTQSACGSPRTSVTDVGVPGAQTIST